MSDRYDDRAATDEAIRRIVIDSPMTLRDGIGFTIAALALFALAWLAA